MEIKPADIDRLINAYKDKITPIHRYASFDYYYNYFQKFHLANAIQNISNEENLEMSVLQLALYLACWGMFRGSAALLRHSSHSLIHVIIFIGKNTDKSHWKINVNNNSEKMKDLEYLYEGIRENLYFRYYPNKCVSY